MSEVKPRLAYGVDQDRLAAFIHCIPLAIVLGKEP